MMLGPMNHGCLLYLASLLLPASAVAAPPQLTVSGTEFVLRLSDDRVLRSSDLVGATLLIDTGAGETEVTIRAVIEDSESVGGQVFLHHFTIADQQGEEVDLCRPDPDGLALGFPLPNESGGFDLTCTSGVVGKCVRWGYRPWESSADGAPMRTLHEACVHMARADYGGDGTATTRDGTLIDVYDRFGIQVPDPEVVLPFEAAWGVDGALCVAHPRIPENVTLEQLAERYPRLRGRIGPEDCSEMAFADHPEVLLFNRSHTRRGEARP